MSQNDKIKVLLCGDVEGRFEALFKRVEAIVKKSGSFDLLLCVGNFFGVNNKEITPYKLGNKKVPIPTYILGPNKQDLLEQYPSDESEYELCPNLYYLGKRGVYTDSKGLKIAYISGIALNNDECDKELWHYDKNDLSDLCDLCLKGNASFRGVDILLTSQWPDGVVETKKQNSLKITDPSLLPSYLCMKLKPRYLVSGLEGVHYERPPFRCPNLGDHDTTLESATRFFGLARVGNTNKEKWIVALNLTPLSKMKLGELLQKTTDETECPFDFDLLTSRIFGVGKKRKPPTDNQYFFDMNSAQNDDKKFKKSKKQHSIEFDQTKCWFCLASPNVEKHLIITIGDFSYMALAKGNLVEEHFLICPIEHYQSLLVLNEQTNNEINKFKDAIKKYYESKGKMAIFFERNYKTSHMQLQAVPIPPKANRELKEIFLDESEAQGFKLQSLESFSRLDQVLQEKVPYFTVQLPDDTILYTKIDKNVNFSLNFAREVLASGPVLNLAEKSDWRECVLKKEDEEELVAKLRKEFEKFDFNV